MRRVRSCASERQFAGPSGAGWPSDVLAAWGSGGGSSGGPAEACYVGQAAVAGAY